MVTPSDVFIHSIRKSTLRMYWNITSRALVSSRLRCCLVLTAVPTSTEKKLGYLFLCTAATSHCCCFRWIGFWQFDLLWHCCSCKSWGNIWRICTITILLLSKCGKWMFDVGSFDPFLIDCCLCFVIVAVENALAGRFARLNGKGRPNVPTSAS